MSASAYSLTAMIPTRAFRVINGELEKGGINGPELEHFFCAGCKTWVFTRIIGTPIIGIDDFVNGAVRNVVGIHATRSPAT